MPHPVSPKILFLAGAHTQGAPLPALVEEIRAIEAELRSLHEREVWKVLPNRAANLDDVFGVFSSKGKDVTIFHYAGHANQHELGLEGGGQVRGIAELFGITQDSTLKLIFLNGCATADHLDSFFGAGLRSAAIIATSRPISDRLLELTSGYTISQ